MKKTAICMLLCMMLCLPIISRAETDIDALLNSMTVREKVGQLFCVQPEALGSATKLTDAAREKLKEYPVGGLILFSDNIKSAEQVDALLADYAGVMRIPPFFSVDEEGGSVARIANSAAYDIENVGNMAKIGKSGDPENARQVGRTIGSYLKDIGFHLSFAPVADVNTNPKNSVIGNRAFSDDPEIAAEMVAAAVEGFHEAGLACTLKHFPGHGDTAGDTHTGSASTDKTWQEMLECEIIPFKAGIAAGADAVMMAHILTPNASSDSNPASLSPEMVTERLRGELGFDGLIITDSLKMAAVSKAYDEADVAAMAALYAGADILLMPKNLTEAFDTMVWAIEEDILPIERVDESVRRVLEFKKEYGII
ncbi:MAG: beta-N-acetylhexosaminidase [Clostridia bacterium]|nr:beta-N-acetylhexosaminidase [Clostridia bacterium]